MRIKIGSNGIYISAADIIIWFSLFCIYAYYSFELIMIGVGVSGEISPFMSYIKVFSFILITALVILNNKIPKKWFIVNLLYILVLFFQYCLWLK